MRLPKRLQDLMSAVGVLGALFSSIRGFVLFCESWSFVSTDRAADRELLKVCNSNSIGSDKFAAACSAARADSASPLVLRAFLRALRTALHEFVDLAGSPLKFLLVVSFLLSIAGSPVLKNVFRKTKSRVGSLRNAIRMRHDSGFREDSGSEDDDDEKDAPLVLVMGDRPSRNSPRLRMRAP